MERRIIEMLDKIEVPEETSRAAEELLMRELVHKGPKVQEEKDKEGETYMKVQVQHKTNGVFKIMGASAATLVAVAGITAAATFHGSNSSSNPVITTSTAIPKDEITETLKARKPYKLKEGKNLIDLDLDGKKEEVTLKNIDTDTSVKEFKITLGNQTISGEVDREGGVKLYAFMMTEAKDSVQLVFTDQYLSEDYTSQVYNYENGRLVQVGTFQSEVDQIALQSDGSFEIVQQNGVLGTGRRSIVRMVKNTGKNPDITGTYCLQEEDQFEKEMIFEYDITALQKVTMYKEMDRNSGTAGTFVTGEKGQTLKVYDGKWLYLENEKGEKGYLEIQLTNILLNGESVVGWEVFDGLPFVD